MYIFVGMFFFVARMNLLVVDVYTSRLILAQVFLLLHYNLSNHILVTKMFITTTKKDTLVTSLL